jgi:hypothetical protein
MTRGRRTTWLLGLALILTGCGGGLRAGAPASSTRRLEAATYRSTPDIGAARGRKFEDIIPVGARITAVNVAMDGGVRAVWLDYEQDGVAGSTPRRGGEGGTTQVLELERNEKLVDLDGVGRRGLVRLTIATNKRVQTFGDDGFTGELSSWLSKQETQQRVGVGITGRADDQVRQLSLRYQVRE